jgi:adenylate cyclase
MAGPSLSNRSSNSVARSLTRRYLASLGAVAFMAIGGQVLIHKQLVRQESDLKIIRVAQERQTICQRLLKEVLRASLMPTQSLSTDERTAMTELITQWKTSRTTLYSNMETMVSSGEMTEVNALFKQLEPSSKEILGSAQRLIDRQPTVSPLGTPTEILRNRIRPPKLIQAERDFTQITDEMIRWYSQKVKTNVSQLKLLESALLGGTLLLLLLEGLLIFRPAVERLRSTLHQLSEALSQVTLEQAKSEKLLLNILPSPIADRLKISSEAIADGFAEVTVLFADIVGFTELSSRLSPKDLVHRLNEIFSAFDALADKHGLEKIKTIGDAYMVVGGLPEPRADHAIAMAHFAIDMRSALQQINQTLGESIDIRIGMNSGPVVAGVIGTKKFIYDLWGDAVNVASRMESHGKPGEIHVSEATYEKIRSHFQLESRGTVHIKGKGDMQTYWLRDEIPIKTAMTDVTPIA